MASKNGHNTNISEFPPATAEHSVELTESQSAALLDAIASAQEAPNALTIPAKLLAELRRLDSEITARAERRQALWDSVEYWGPVDLAENRATFDHAAGVVLVTPAREG